LNRKAMLPLFFLMAVNLCSCALLPKEDQPLTAPVMKKYDPAQYNIYTVTRGDIQKNVTISVSYVHAVTQTLSFQTGGLVISKVNVSKGDSVKKGDILASLDTSDIDGPLSDVKNQLAANETAAQNSEALYQIDKKISALTPDGNSRAAADYAARSADLEFDRKALQLRLDLLQKKEAERYITAGIDGVISYMAPIKQGDISIKNSGIITLDSGSSSVFSATGSNAPLLVPGTVVDINVNGDNGGTYRAKAGDPASLGITEPSKDAAYLALDEPVNFPENTFGTIVYTADERKNVLYIPSAAITKVRDRLFVYLLDENNIKTIRDVKIGLDAGANSEITDGLKEGEKIIVGNNR